ncbi:LOW QUALITY PROTEIN: hypothetical protein ACJ72_00704 [Emergomyces africanus]|uniref:Uncharacterized protein n=1 Tax=Emergomyces africanus TaxID=1955775 RepID=A0A1B7P7F3_9EURO|nr:LOW QUALITY PROTEIN: hypothetical protein ACJ72_00704 [Emergomyces africanus]
MAHGRHHLVSRQNGRRPALVFLKFCVAAVEKPVRLSYYVQRIRLRILCGPPGNIDDVDSCKKRVWCEYITIIVGQGREVRRHE